PRGSPRRLDLEARAHNLLLIHEADWLGPLLGVIANWEWRAGPPASITLCARPLPAPPPRRRPPPPPPPPPPPHAQPPPPPPPPRQAPPAAPPQAAQGRSCAGSRGAQLHPQAQLPAPPHPARREAEPPAGSRSARRRLPAAPK